MKKNIHNVANIVVACHDKLAQYYENDSFFYTKEFVKKFLNENNFIIDAEIESLYHIIIYAHHM